MAEWRSRMEAYREARLHPRLPARAMIAFYPMSKRRDEGANWYELGFEERKRLMGGHARVGRRYAGRILQLITGATGLDDWEWGVTLLADDPAAIKEIVYEMRFDEVSSRYAEFGPFFVGLVMEPRAAFARAGVIGSRAPRPAPAPRGSAGPGRRGPGSGGRPPPPAPGTAPRAPDPSGRSAAPRRRSRPVDAVDAQEAAQVDVADDLDLDAVQRDAELGRPEPGR